MAGGFSIDVEIGKGDGGFRIFCATLTHTWTVDRSVKDLQELRTKFDNNKDIRKYLPRAPDMSSKDEKVRRMNVQVFFCNLCCSTQLLRMKLLHDFLNVPDTVRDSLKYCYDRGMGRVLKHGKLTRYNVFAKDKALTFQREYYASLSENNNLFIRESKDATQILGAFKIGQSTKLKKAIDQENALELRSGEKYWYLRTVTNREFTQWYQTISAAVDKRGGEIVESDGSKKKSKLKIEINLNNKKKHKKDDPNLQAKQMQESNRELKSKLKQTQKDIDKARDTIDDLNSEKDKLTREQQNQRRQIKKQFEDERTALTQKYELEHEKLRTKIEQLHRKLEIKTMKEGGFKGLVRMYEEGYEAPSDQYQEIDDTQDLIEYELKEKGDLVNDSDVKYIHKHLHKHNHKHVFHHRHTHIHDDAQDPSIVYTQTHTIAHTICHTHTQIKIKEKKLISLPSSDKIS